MFIAPLIFLIGLSGIGEVSFTLFGLSYAGASSLHPIAMAVTSIATLSATVAYGILWGKDWAPQLGIIYGWIGLATCAFAFAWNLNNGTVRFSLEPALLIPFMITLSKKKKEWMDYDASNAKEIEAESSDAKKASNKSQSEQSSLGS